MVLTNAQYKAVQDVRAHNVLEDLQVKRPQLLTGHAAVVGNVKEIEGHIVVKEGMRQRPRTRLVVFHPAHAHLVGAELVLIEAERGLIEDGVGVGAGVGA